MKSPGFTLTELLVVIVIIAALAGITYPIATRMVRSSRETACIQQLRSLGIGLQGYLQDHNDILPTLASARASRTSEEPVLETVLRPYVGSEDAFHCPADFEQFAKTGSSYLWNSTQNGLHITRLKFLGISDQPGKIPLIADKEAWHPHGTNFLYADFSSSNRPTFATGN